MLTLFIVGLVAGVSFSSFFLGKELYSYYKKNASLLIKIQRIELMNRQLINKHEVEKRISSAKNKYN